MRNRAPAAAGARRWITRQSSVRAPGDWELILTPNVPVPRTWFGEVRGRDVLCLASGGGQQAPVLAAAGAKVTSYDLSDEQLAKDQLVAEREGLPLTTVRGDMARLTALSDASFDLIFHPVSNVFAEDVRPVWAECFRVLRPRRRIARRIHEPAFLSLRSRRSARGRPARGEVPAPLFRSSQIPIQSRSSAGWRAD
jgi:SAM-dependent methyltransferase